MIQSQNVTAQSLRHHDTFGFCLACVFLQLIQAMSSTQARTFGICCSKSWMLLL